MSDLIKIPTVSIKPTHLTFYYEVPNGRRSNNSTFKPLHQPKSNKAGMELSCKSKKRLVNGINWLITLAESKRIFNAKTNRHFSFKVNLITLTLPTFQAHLDTTIKTVCFNNFLTELRKYHGLRNYVWRAELQGNGNIHFHIATDTFFHWGVIRRIWNRLLKKLGYIQRYHAKFSGLSFEEYRRKVDPKKARCISKLLSAYNYGIKTNWRDPNTTDIHSLKKVRNVASYISKYLSKQSKADTNQEESSDIIRRIRGRQWGQSQSLSKCKGVVDMVNDEIEALINWADKKLKPKVIADDFFTVWCIRMDDWKSEFQSLFRAICAEVRLVSGFKAGGLSKAVKIV